MATVVYSSIGITEMRGKAGGNIFTRNANGSYMKKNTKPTNPDTALQQASRAIFSQVAQAWRELTDEQRQAWIEAAPNFPYTNRAGDTAYYTGQQFFMKLNSSRLQLNPTDPILTTPPSPVSLDAIYALEDLNMTYDESSSVLVMATTINNLSGLPAGQSAMVYVTGVVSPGVMRPKKFIRLGAITPTVSGEVNFGALYEARLGVPADGGKIFVKMETVDDASGITIPGTMYATSVTYVP